MTLHSLSRLRRANPSRTETLRRHGLLHTKSQAWVASRLQIRNYCVSERFAKRAMLCRLNQPTDFAVFYSIMPISGRNRVGRLGWG